MASPNSAAQQSSQKQKSPLSPLLEHTRRIHVEAMESRTTRRIGELMGGQPAVFRREQLMEGTESTPLEEGHRSDEMRHDRAFVAQLLRSDEVRPDRARAAQPSLVHRMDSVRQQPSPSSHKEAVGQMPIPHPGSFPTLQSGRHNITQRRSRGRSGDDADSIVDPTIAARRPRSRSKDRRYSVKSNGAVSWRDSDAALESLNREQTPAMRPQTPSELFRCRIGSILCRHHLLMFWLDIWQTGILLDWHPQRCLTVGPLGKRLTSDQLLTCWGDLILDQWLRLRTFADHYGRILS